MTERKKQACILLGIAIPLLAFGIAKFEFNGGNSSAMAMFISISITVGLVSALSGLVMLFTKAPLGIFDEKKPKPKIKKEKEMVTKKEGITKEKPVKKSGSESIGLMQREKELVKRADELTTLVNEVETELNQVRENLETKGWVNSDKGWVIE